MSYLNQTEKENFVLFRVKDLTAPKEDFEREVYDKKKKKIVPFTYFTPKQFDELVKAKEEDEENPISPVVVGNVKIFKNKYKDIKPEQTDDEFVKEKRDKKIYGRVDIRYTREYIEKHKNKLNGDTYQKFDLYEAKNCKCLGYAEVGDNKYVRLVKRSPFFFILIFLLCLGLLLSTAALVPNLPDDFKDLIGLEDTDPHNGEENRGEDSQVIQETYEIPYVPYVKLTEKEPNLYLVNPKGNTVYFMYSLYIDEDGSGYIEADEAVDKNGKSKAFYETKLIAPGQMKAVNVRNILGKGEFKVVQKISALNYAPGTKEEQAPCNGSNLTTVIKID